MRLEKCVRLEDIADANDTADRISAAMQTGVPIDARSILTSVSVGIALGSPRYDQPEDILRDADIAMYAPKAGGRGRSMVFTSV